MRILVQDCVTRRFLGEGSLWGSSAAEARNFRTSGEASDFCFSSDLKDVQVVLHFDFAVHQNIELPLGKPSRQMA